MPKNDAMTKLKKTEFIPFLDSTKGNSNTGPTWVRIDLSTIFELSINEEEEDKDYICYDTPRTEIKFNKPDLPQEIAVYEGNSCYDFLFEELFDLPTYDDCIVPCLICFGGTDKKAWKTDATISEKKLNTVDGIISFTIKFGDVIKGTYTITSGVPTFTPASGNAEKVDINEAVKDVKESDKGAKKNNK